MIRAGGQSKIRPGRGAGNHAIDGDSLGLLDERELTARLLRSIAAPNYRPPRLPRVAMEILSISRDPNVEFKRIEALLEEDALLAGEILSIARSAFYCRLRPADTLREALAILGIGRIREVVAQAAVTLRVFRSKCYQGCMERLRDHSRATAHLARMVAVRTTVPAEQAFLCGLLHDVGIAGILLVLGEPRRGEAPPALEMLWSSIHNAHADAGARMVKLWGLPAEVASAVGAHHQVRVDGTNNPLAAVVCLAEQLAWEVGSGFSPVDELKAADADLTASGLTHDDRIDRTDPVTVERAGQTLNFDASDLGLMRTITRQWAQLRDHGTGG